MNTDLTTFNFLPTDGAEVSRPVRTVQIDGEPWFVAKDVCDVLGIVNDRQAAGRLDDDEKGVCKVDTLGGNQSVNVISESGLYALALTSNKPEAKAFSRWVRKTVLPTIRKTGSYIAGEEVLDRDAPDYLDRLKDLMLEAQERKLAAAEAIIQAQAPKVEALERLSASEGSVTLTDAARLVNMAQRTFLQWMNDNGWTFTKRGKANGNRRLPYADKRAEGLMEVVATTAYHHGAEITVESCYVTAKGLAKLAEVIRK